MDPVDENFDTSKMVDFFPFFIENVYFCSQSLARTVSLISRRFLENIQIAELVDVISDKLTEHPVLRFVVLATALSCVIPVVMFIVFGFVSVIVTFAGFLFIEGTLLAIGGLCMFICLVAIVMVMSVLIVSFGLFYLLALKFFKLEFY